MIQQDGCDFLGDGMALAGFGSVERQHETLHLATRFRQHLQEDRDTLLLFALALVELHRDRASRGKKLPATIVDDAQQGSQPSTKCGWRRCE